MTAPANYIDAKQYFYYAAEGPVTATMLADSLLGLDGIVRNAAKALAASANITLKDAELIIENIELGSYKDCYVVRLFFGKGREMEKNIEAFRKALGLKDMANLKTYLGIFIGATVLWGAYELFKPKDETKDTIHIHFENSFNNWAPQVNMKPEELKEVIIRATKNKEELKKDIIKVLHPDGNESTGSIQIGDEEAIVIPKEVLAVVPTKYEKVQEPEQERKLQKRQIIVRATDLDSTKNGWAAIVPEINEKRFPLILDETVQATEVPWGKLFWAQIEVEEKKLKSGDIVPIRYHLRKVLHKENQPE
ncbi:hypothetical protein [Prosthecobacter debontii]|nr:hypothetical protein [Prosthecobacter debontii]